MTATVASEKKQAGLVNAPGIGVGKALEQELARGLTALELTLTREQQATLLSYVQLLQKWNRVYNLTAVREPERMLSHHLFDSLAVIPAVNSHASHGQGGLHVLDVGSGAGLPGIPIAVACPDIDVTMLDCNHKKAAFMQQVVAELSLKKARVECQRVEQWQTPRRFDVIVSRAFAGLSEFVELAKHLLAPGGVFIAMKGLHPHDEIAHLPPAFKLQKVMKLAVPRLEAERHLVFVTPVTPCSESA